MRLSKSIFILAVFLLSGLVAAAQVPSASRKQAVKSKTQRYVELVARNDVLKSSVFGVLAMTEDGDTVAAWNPGQRMIPASTQIQRCSRFIQQKDLGIIIDGTTYGKPFFHTERHFARCDIQKFINPEHLKESALKLFFKVLRAIPHSEIIPCGKLFYDRSPLRNVCH